MLVLAWVTRYAIALYIVAIRIILTPLLIVAGFAMGVVVGFYRELRHEGK